MRTVSRPCFACSFQDGIRFELQPWHIAGVGDLVTAMRVCGQCGGVLQDPAPAPETMAVYYQKLSNYTNSTRDGLPSPVTQISSGQQRQLIQAHLQPGRVYEVGCATGFTLAQLMGSGWIATGCDPSPAAANIARQRWGLEIEPNLFEKARVPEHPMDLVIFSHVLEHLYNPNDALKKARSFLRPKGYLCIEVPCLTHPEYWPNGYFTFEHLNLFSERTLARCLHDTGFEWVDHLLNVEFPLYPVITVLARLSDDLIEGSFKDDPVAISGMIRSYQELENREWGRIDAHLKVELDGIERLVIWGGGVHTSQLLSSTRILEDKQILGILDSDRQKNGLKIRGIEVQSPETFNFAQSDIAIVISTRASEGEVYRDLQRRKGLKCKVIRLYNFEAR